MKIDHQPSITMPLPGTAVSTRPSTLVNIASELRIITAFRLSQQHSTRCPIFPWDGGAASPMSGVVSTMVFFASSTSGSDEGEAGEQKNGEWRERPYSTYLLLRYGNHDTNLKKNLESKHHPDTDERWPSTPHYCGRKCNN